MQKLPPFSYLFFFLREKPAVATPYDGPTCRKIEYAYNSQAASRVELGRVSPSFFCDFREENAEIAPFFVHSFNKK